MAKKIEAVLIGLMIGIVGLSASTCSDKSETKGIIIQTEAGTLRLMPLNDRSIRVRFTRPDSKEMEELIYVGSTKIPKYRIKESQSQAILSLDNISAIYNKGNNTLIFKDRNGKIVLEEKVGGRRMEQSTIQGEPTYLVEQQFISPVDEYLYGTGQFQDGYLNVRGLTRRLTQVNTQIAIPFILSNKGYGLLWSNYGLTDFNPADKSVKFSRGNDNCRCYFYYRK